MKKQLPALVVSTDTIVNNSISMNFNQNDLLDLVIQEKIDQLEAQLETLKEGTKNDYNTHHQIIIKQVLKDNPKAYSDFTSIVAKLGILPKDFVFENIHNTITKQEPDDRTFTYKISNRHRDNRKNPLDEFVASTYDCKLNPNRIQNITFNISAKTKENIEVYKSCTYKLTKSQSESLFKKEVLFAQVYSDLCNEKYAIEKELLKYTHQEKKIKAQFTKAYLVKSVQGKDIIKLLEKATKVKLAIE